MKIICWNSAFYIKAENEQDCEWLYEWLDSVDEHIDQFIEIELGAFDSEGKLEIQPEDIYTTTYLKSYIKWTDKKIRETFVKYRESPERDKNQGEYLKVVGINISSFGF